MIGFPPCFHSQLFLFVQSFLVCVCQIQDLPEKKTFQKDSVQNLSGDFVYPRSVKKMMKITRGVGLGLVGQLEEGNLHSKKKN